MTATVACGAGFAGDRIEPAVELAASGLADCVVLECLAERTLVSGLTARAADPTAGYDVRLRRRLAPLLPAARSTGCRVVTNLGAANPLAAARSTAVLARSLGLRDARIAVVTGDDLSDRTGVVRWDAPPPADAEWLGVHAYLGTDAITESLAAGADLVVTGRVADSALFAAPLRSMLDLDEHGLAGATTIGHLLECGGQLTGGNLADTGGRQLGPQELAGLGYPLATVEPDGTAVIGVLPGRPARLDPLTCTLQLLYEVHDPRAYHTPDITLDFSGIGFEPLRDNEVRVTGARGRGRPPALRAVGFVRLPGQVADVEIGYAGCGALGRAKRAADTLRLRLATLGAEQSNVDIVGVDSVLGPATIGAAEPAEVRVHASVACPSTELAQAVEDEVYALTLAGPAGGAALRSERRPHVQVLSGLVARDQVTERWEVVDA